jgi:hypothetical protein
MKIIICTIKEEFPVISWIFNKKKVVLNDCLKLVGLSGLIVLIEFLIQGNIGFNIADEGYLWYGSIHTLAGQVPLRDFQSYDPGRYYWDALWMYFWGTGIMPLRVAESLFQVIGLSFGLATVRTFIRSWWKLTLVGVFLTLWMNPSYKIFDHSLAMMSVFFITRLIEKPTFKRHFILGLAIGMAAFFGRNHGVYALFATILAVVFLKFKLKRNYRLKRIWGAMLGLIIGYSPMLLMLIFVPGFLNTLWDSILSMFRSGSTNLPLPVPWPWKPDYAKLDYVGALNLFSIGSFFILLPLFYFLRVINLFKLDTSEISQCSPMIASIFVGIPYMHYIFSRADFPHIALGVHPFLIGVLAAVYQNHTKRSINSFYKAFLIIVIAMSVYTAGLSDPFVSKFRSPTDAYVKTNITDSTLWVDKGTSNMVNIFKNCDQIYSNQNILVGPYATSIYPILGKSSPVWTLCFLLPENTHESIEKQREMIKMLDQNSVNLAFMMDVAFDGRETMRFKYQYNLVWEYFLDNYKIYNVDGLPGYTIFHRE